MKILIIKFSALGDLVMCEPFIRAIKLCSKNSKIDFLTSNLGLSLYNDYSYFEEFIVYENFFNTLRIINAKKYDLIINLHCNRKSHYLSILSNVSSVINISSNIFQKILNLKHKSKSVEEILYSMNTEKSIINDYISIKDYEKVELSYVDELIYFPLGNKNKIIGISTGCSEKWSTKQWGINRYSELISMLIKNNYYIVLIGTKLELSDEKILKERFGNNILSYVNKTNISELKSLISKVDLFIGNDSGPTHIAAGLGVNTITIFGATSENHCVRNLPYFGKHFCLIPKPSITCHPCYKSKCPTMMECMESISVEEVFKKVNLLMKKEKE